MAESGAIALEQVDDPGLEWLASGPAGEALGPLAEALARSAAVDSDPLWIDAVVDAVRRELIARVRRSMLLVKRGTGTWYHVTFTSNRESILEHGLDWRRMAGQGIAGSAAPDRASLVCSCRSAERSRSILTSSIVPVIVAQ